MGRDTDATGGRAGGSSDSSSSSGGRGHEGGGLAESSKGNIAGTGTSLGSSSSSVGGLSASESFARARALRDSFSAIDPAAKAQNAAIRAGIPGTREHAAAVERQRQEAQAAAIEQATRNQMAASVAPTASLSSKVFGSAVPAMVGTPLGEELAGVLEARTINAIESPEFSSMPAEVRAGYINRAARMGYTGIATSAFNDSIKEDRSFLGRIEDAIFDKEDEGKITSTQMSELAAIDPAATRAALGGYISGDLKTNTSTGMMQQDVMGRVLGLMGSVPGEIAAFAAAPIGAAFGAAKMGSALGSMFASTALKPSIGLGTVKELYSGNIPGAIAKSLPFGGAITELDRLSTMDQQLGLSPTKARVSSAAKNTGISMPDALATPYGSIKSYAKDVDTFLGDTVTSPVKKAASSATNMVDSIYDSIKNKILE